MSITWKDGLTTLLALVVIGFSYLMTVGYKFPLVSGYRWATAILLILGIGMCALSSARPDIQSNWISLANILGVVAFVLIIAGIITGSKMVFLSLSGTIVVLWLVATIRHLFT